MSKASYPISWPNLHLSSGRAAKKVFYSHPAYGRRSDSSRGRVHVRAAELLPIVAHAVRSGKSWIDDVADETIEISQDMFEILLAYQQQIVRAAA